METTPEAEKKKEAVPRRSWGLLAVVAVLLMFIGGTNLAVGILGSPTAEAHSFASLLRNGGTLVSGCALLLIAWRDRRTTAAPPKEGA